MEKHSIRQRFNFKENNSFICINNTTPKVLNFSKSPKTNVVGAYYEKKIPNNQKGYIKNNEKILLKKKPYINFNFNLIQNKNQNEKKIRTITPNVRLRDLVHKKYEENSMNNLKNDISFPDIKKYNNNSRNKSYNMLEDHNFNIHNKTGKNLNLDRQLKLIFVMKNKINELNKIIKEKNQEILELRINNNNVRNVSENKNLSNNIGDKKEMTNLTKDKANKLKKKNINKITICSKKNDETEKLNREIQNLNKIINNLGQKYKQEMEKNKEFSQKYNYIKNCTFGMGGPTIAYEDKIKNYENKIINLEEQIFQYKKQHEKNSKERIILNDEEYSNIQLCLNALIQINGIKEESILQNLSKNPIENTEKISNTLCRSLNISDNNVIMNFINDYIIKNKFNILNPITLEKLTENKISENDTYNYNREIVPFIQKKCRFYDYLLRGVIPMYFLRNIYKEYCFKNYKEEDKKEFYTIVYICKKNIYYNKNNFYLNSIYDMYYENLSYEEGEFKKNQKVVKEFIDSLMEETINKIHDKSYNINTKIQTNKYNYYDDDFII